MGPEILKDWQRTAIDFVFAQPEAQSFYFSGGTALAAYYLRHRVSEDLDFFSAADFPTLTAQRIANGLREALQAAGVRYQRLHDRRQFILENIDGEEGKVEFVFYPFPQLEPVRHHGSARVDSEFDLAVNKLMALTDRFEPKDFVDLFFLFPKYSLLTLREGVSRKFHVRLDPVFLGTEFMKVNRVAGLPKMIEPLTLPELRERFIREAESLRSEILE